MKKVVAFGLMVTLFLMIFTVSFPQSMHASDKGPDPLLALIINLIFPGIGHLLAGSVGGCFQTILLFNGMMLVGILMDYVLTNLLGFNTYGMCTGCSYLGAIIYLWIDSFSLYNKLSDQREDRIREEK